jgi:hypothetical protein
MRRRNVAAITLSLVLLAVGTSNAQVNKCAGTKIKTAGKKAKCLLGIDAKAARYGVAPDPAKLQKCRDKLAAAFAKAESKIGCLTGGDAQDIEDKVEAFRVDVKAELEMGLPNGCQGAKIKAVGSKASCLLGLEAKEAAKGTPPDPAKVQKCRDKLASTFAQSEAKGGCATVADAQDLEDKVDAFVMDVDGELATIPNFCGDATNPQCDGLCGPGQVCVNTFMFCNCVAITGGCGVQGGSPECSGSCPEATPFCIDNAGTCACAAAPPP